MFSVSRDLLAAVWKWTGGTGSGDDDESGWEFGAGRVETRMGAAFELWQAWKFHNALPQAGGWLDQPLDLLAQIGAVDLVYSTKVYLDTKGSDWSKLTATQRELIAWLKGNNG